MEAIERGEQKRDGNMTTHMLIQTDVLDGMTTLENESIDMILTSPPYWGLRDYGMEGQWGNESHPNEWIERMVLLGREIRRVLKPGGSYWLNVGDTYFGSGGAGGDYNKGGSREGQPRYKQAKVKPTNWLQPKQLMLMPSRLAVTMQDDGWILRNDIIWYKNSMPQSVKDRFSNTFEHLFLFVKQRKYFFNLDAVRVPHKSKREHHLPGKNPGDFFDIKTQPFPGAHFAVFPEKLCEIPIKAGCPNGGIVLDPFAGSGTVAKVALDLGRSSISIELNPSYCELIRKRLKWNQKRLDVQFDYNVFTNKNNKGVNQNE